MNIGLSAAALQLSWTRLLGSLRTYLGSSYLAPEMLTALVNNLNTLERVKTKTNQMENRTSFIVAESQVSIWNNYTGTFHDCLRKGYLRLCCNTKGIPNFCTRLQWLVQGLNVHEHLKALCIQDPSRKRKLRLANNIIWSKHMYRHMIDTKR